MAEISNNPQVNAAAWQFYGELKSQDDQLTDAIQEIGQPDYDPNLEQSTNS